jgi:cation transport ATPase
MLSADRRFHMDTTYTLSGMHCGACVGRITTALQPFAESVSVTLNPPRAVLSNPNTNATLSAIQAAVTKAGAYAITPETHTARRIEPSTEPQNDNDNWLATYWPLILIVGYIAIAALAGTPAPGETRLAAWMTNFMAGFFLVFSAFKFLNLRGFADAYASYDLLAKRWRAYGFMYPFLELALGLAYLFRFEPTLTHIATILLMGFSSLGVLDVLRQNRKIACACLGTVLKLPMSTITLVEDLGMVAMAGLMLLA